MKYKELTKQDKIDFLDIFNKEGTRKSIVNELTNKFNISPRSVHRFHERIIKEFYGTDETTVSLNEIVLNSDGEFVINKDASKDDIIASLIKENRKLRKAVVLQRDNNNLLRKEGRDLIREDLKIKKIYELIEKATQYIKPIDSIKPPKFVNEDLCTFYPLPDLHIGLLVNKDETNHGYNYDLKIARKWILSAMNHLINEAPNSEYAIITDLGDFLHSADNNNRTKSGHVLDVDGRHYKIITIAFELTRLLIEESLKKHKKILFYSVPGNHSDLSGIYLKAYLKAWYKNNERVEIIEKHTSQQYYRFGKNIIGFSHGHELKPEKASDVLIYDNKDYISNGEFNYFHFGHFHQNKIFETPMCKIEIHKNIIPRDVWAEGMGFRGNIGEAKSIIYHKTYGEINRNVFNIKMIKNEEE